MRSTASIVGLFFVSFALVLAADTSAAQDSVTTKITIEVTVENGAITDVIPKMFPKVSSFSKGAVLQIEVYETSTTAGFYEIVFSHKTAEIAQFPVKTGAEKAQLLSFTKRDLVFTKNLTLDEAGQSYLIQINRYKTYDDMLKDKDKNGRVVYQESFHTRRIYHVGLNAGWLFPIGHKAYSYALYPKDPTDTSDSPAYTIHQSRSYQTKAILFASLYPWGFEPEAPLGCRAVQLNLGTEISSSILKSIYIGIGYDLRIVSLNLFAGFFRTDQLAPGYYVGQDVVNKKTAALPLVGKSDYLVGVCLGLPINLAGIFGKILGL